jgi:hypothetical protein
VSTRSKAALVSLLIMLAPLRRTGEGERGRAPPPTSARSCSQGLGEYRAGGGYVSARYLHRISALPLHRLSASGRRWPGSSSAISSSGVLSSQTSDVHLDFTRPASVSSVELSSHAIRLLIPCCAAGSTATANSPATNEHNTCMVSGTACVAWLLGLGCMLLGCMLRRCRSNRRGLSYPRTCMYTTTIERVRPQVDTLYYDCSCSENCHRLASSAAAAMVVRHRKLLARLRCLAYVYSSSPWCHFALPPASRLPSRCSVVATVP